MVHNFTKPLPISKKFSFLESVWKVPSGYEIWWKSEIVGWLFHFLGSFDIEWPLHNYWNVTLTSNRDHISKYWRIMGVFNWHICFVVVGMVFHQWSFISCSSFSFCSIDGMDHLQRNKPASETSWRHDIFLGELHGSQLQEMSNAGTLSLSRQSPIDSGTEHISWLRKK